MVRRKKTSAKKLVKKKKSSIPLSKLRDELDRVFSLYIRQKSSDKNGDAKCVTCGSVKEWRKQHCGHYISRRHLSLRWEIKNCEVQCVGCNIFNQGAGSSFALFLIKKYGVNHLEWLEIKKNNTMKMDRFAYQSLMEEYKQKIENIGGVLK
jgi:hypothetical protein